MFKYNYARNPSMHQSQFNMETDAKEKINHKAVCKHYDDNFAAS